MVKKNSTSMVSIIQVFTFCQKEKRKRKEFLLGIKVLVLNFDHHIVKANCNFRFLRNQNDIIWGSANIRFLF